MLQNTLDFIAASPLLSSILRMTAIILATWLIARMSGWLAVLILKNRSVEQYGDLPEKRRLTLQSLVRSAVRVLVYVIGGVVILFSLGVPGGSILTALGLFSAGFGFGARPIISDYLSGLFLIFEDQFSVGEKVEMLEVTGTIEAVELRTTHLRSTTGELYIVPNGDVRMVRNLSRGLFSMATIDVTVATENLPKAMEVLQEVANAAEDKFDDLLEPFVYVSEEGKISAYVELTLLAKARHGRDAHLRTRLMAMVTDALKEAGVQIIS